MATGSNFTSIHAQRSDALRRQRDEVIEQALTTKTDNKYILALRKELEGYKQNAKSWEKQARESCQDVDDILSAAKVKTIPELLEMLAKKGDY